MKIEFRKVPQTAKEFETEFNSVKLEGTFCKISPSLIKISAKMSGPTEIECCRCGKTEEYTLDEELDFLLSDGIFNKESEDLVIEIENNTIDFDEIIQNEIASIQSEYHYCSECETSTEAYEQEF